MLQNLLNIGGLLLCCGLPLVAIAAAIVVVARNRGNSEAQRLEELNSMISSEWQPGPADAAAADTSTPRESLSTRLDNVLSSRGFAGNIRSQLRKADLKFTVAEYLVLHLVLAFGLGLIGFILWPGVRAVIPFIGGFFIPRIYVTFRQKQRLQQFDGQLPDILSLWVNALRAGYSVPQAMEAVSREAAAPACDEFKRVVAEMAIGVPIETALNNMLSRIESEDLDLVFTAVNIQREVGGNLAEILDTITFTIRERIRIKGEIRVLTSSGRATGTIIGLLPVGLSLLLMLINPTYMGQLFLGPPVGAHIPGTGIPCGWPFVAVGVTMLSIGIAVINRIIDIEV